MAITDITVRGAGIFGLSIAWACLQRGAKVRVVDPGGPGAGSSGGLVGALAPHVPENWNDKKAIQFDSLIRAESFWAEVETVSGLDPGYARSGRLQPIADDHGLELARQRGENAVTLWQGKAAWQIISASDFPDWAPLTPTGYLIHDTLTARMAPRRAAASLAAAITASGGEIVTDAPDQGQVIWATGAQGLVALSEEFGKLVGVGVKGQSALLHYDARDLPQLFAGGVHVIPHGDGTVAIGSTSEREFDDPHSCDAQLDEVLDKARTAVPALRDAPVIERWAGVRPRARTRAPMLGAYPERPGHFIANGGFKIGFGMAPKVAELMANLVLEGRDGIPEHFGVAANL
ncbi:FAD-dependent oxidoreductase [Aliiroseovarius subalbicans]|uniref:NAD(P)/FAD-dependent oxidoreductase n=1 Tax=Aliiroseovarius subalbicans TaxID=2925840 RepID=UPI001F599ECE|nr:FAD-dependent oxidoreductase [Aliiroseovarius subalbicans]MCI2399750.1 FAD-binding oxidoreductase [Aliiroseovarius subalbicans]